MQSSKGNSAQRIHIFNLSSFSSFLFKDTLSPSRTSSDITPCKSSASCHQIKDVCRNLGPLSKHSCSLPGTTMLRWEHASWRPLDTQEGFQVQQANTWSLPGFPSISIWSGAQMENPGVPLAHPVSHIMPNPPANPLGSIGDRCTNSNHSHHWPPPPFAQNLPGFGSGPWHPPGLLWWLRGQEPICQCRRHGSDPCVRKIPWRRKWQLTPVLLPGKETPWTEKAGGRQSLGIQELDMTWQLNRDMTSFTTCPITPRALGSGHSGFQPLQHGDLVPEHSSPNSCIMPSHLLRLFTQRPSPR